MVNTQEVFYQLAPRFTDTHVDQEGKIEFANRRFVFFHTSMFSRLTEDMEEAAGPVIKRKIQEFGVKSGKYIGQKMDEDLEDTTLKDVFTVLYYTRLNPSKIKKMMSTTPESQFRKILGYAKHVGWLGETEIHEFSDAKVRLAVENTFESDSYGETGKKECDYIKGTFQGIMTYFWDEEDLEAEEIQCASEGHENCIMEVRKNV